MKLIELRPSTSECPHVILTADSGIVNHSRPIFLADASQPWRAELSVAYRIGRLGKSIGRRFAHRYIDAMTLVARFIPINDEAALSAEGWTGSAWYTSCDGAVASGTWVDVAPIDAVALTSPVAERIEVPESTIDAAIETITRRFIIKTGDIIVADGPLLSFDVKIDDTVTAQIDGTTVLQFRIK